MSPASSAQSNINLRESSNAASIIFGDPPKICPNVPSIVIKSPSLKIGPSEIEKALLFDLKLISETPTTQGSPSPRPITAAWLVIPPLSVKTPAAACIPRISSGLVSRRTKIQASPRAAHDCAAEAEKTTIPVAAPGLAATPFARMFLSAFGSICLCNNSPTARGSTLMRASSLVIILSFAKLTAIVTAARGLLVTRIPSKMCNCPFSIVNSICISSRNFFRINSAFFISSLKILVSSVSRDGPLASRVRYSAPCLSDKDSRP